MPVNLLRNELEISRNIAKKPLFELRRIFLCVVKKK